MIDSISIILWFLSPIWVYITLSSFQKIKDYIDYRRNDREREYDVYRYAYYFPCWHPNNIFTFDEDDEKYTEKLNRFLEDFCPKDRSIWIIRKHIKLGIQTNLCRDLLKLYEKEAKRLLKCYSEEFQERFENGIRGRELYTINGSEKEYIKDIFRQIDNFTGEMLKKSYKSYVRK